MKKKINILNIGIDPLTQEELYRKINMSLTSKNKIKIFTPNPEIIIKASKEESLKNILNSANILIADGSGIVLASKLLATPIPQRLTGIDTAEYILDVASKTGLSIFLLGGKSDVVQLAKEKLEKKYKGIEICGIHHGYFDTNGIENINLITKINNAKPDILFVCMGFPRQEIWISENLDKLHSVCLSMGLGGSLDVWSGKIKRAPLFFRKMSLEWLWRIILEPRRIKFVFQIPVFISKILRQKETIKVSKDKIDGKNAHI